MATPGLTCKEITRRLEATDRRTTEREIPTTSRSAGVRPAAVLVPLFLAASAWHLLFIRRAENAADYHSGQVAFPGGRLESHEYDPRIAALREAEEEVGLVRQDIRILGQMSPFHTVSDFLVTPVVAQIPWPVDLKPAPDEVSHVFSMPLTWLAQPTNHHTRMTRLQGHQGERPVIYFRPYRGEQLWGVSARITLDLIRILYRHDTRAPNTS